MKYLFVIDYDHLDKGGFLKELARKFAEHNPGPSLILHSDSEYTSRIVETGVMSDQARLRSIKELNHRLTALFADEGVALAAMNAYQRNTVMRNENGAYKIDDAYLTRLGKYTHVLCSNLVAGADSRPQIAPLAELAVEVRKSMNLEKIFVFDAHDSGFKVFTEGDEKNTPKLPDEFKGFDSEVNIISLESFNRLSGTR